jgi:phosphatidylserine decarboxylase
MLIGSVVLAITAVALGYTWWPLALIVIPVLLWLFAFFRDPERTIPAEPHAMLSPADGTVSDITQLDDCKELGCSALRVGIFLSVFSVHVNRSPCDGKVLSVNYRKGKFVNALRHHQASDENESNTLVLADQATDRPIAVVKQIAGMIARRIVCTVKPGDLVQRGRRIGMIKFGSRTELYIPTWLAPQIKVQVGQTVRGAADIIAILQNPVHPNLKIVNAEEFETLVPQKTPA